MEASNQKTAQAIKKIIKNRIDSIDSMDAQIIEDNVPKYESHLCRISGMELDEIQLTLAKKGVDEREYFKRIISAIGALTGAHLAEEDKFGYDTEECLTLNEAETEAYGYLTEQTSEARKAYQEYVKAGQAEAREMLGKAAEAFGHPEFSSKLHPDLSKEDLDDTLSSIKDLFNESYEDEDESKGLDIPDF